MRMVPDFSILPIVLTVIITSIGGLIIFETTGKFVRFIKEEVDKRIR